MSSDSSLRSMEGDPFEMGEAIGGVWVLGFVTVA